MKKTKQKINNNQNLIICQIFPHYFESNKFVTKYLLSIIKKFHLNPLFK